MAKKKSSLSNRYAKSYESKDSGTGASAFDWRKVEGEVKFFNPKEGKIRLNIIPYTIKTKNHPLVKSGDMAIGDLDYVMDVYVHGFIGPGNASVICPKKNYAKACPICEEAEKLKQKGKQKEFEELKPKRKVYYNVQDIKNPDQIQVFEVSHFLFEKELIEEARSYSDDGDIVDFADPESGKTIVCRASTTSMGKHEYLEYKSFQFMDREDEIEDDILSAAVSFDEIMKVQSYEEIEKILYGSDDEEDEDEEEKPSKKSTKKADDDDEDDIPEKKPAKKKPADDDDDEENEKPSKKPDKKKNDEEDEEEKPAKKPDKKKADDDDKPAGPKCPSGHKYGTDCDDFEECNDCDLWDKCVKAQKAAKK